jgi:predicted dehydrogenase
MAKASVSSDSLAAETKQEFKGKKLRMALIGCGGIAQVHLGALQNFPDVEIVAGVDIDPERLKVMAEKWNVKDTFSDWKKMLKAVQPDAVNICTPNSLHAAPAIDAASAGCHVLPKSRWR